MADTDESEVQGASVGRYLPKASFTMAEPETKGRAFPSARR